MTYEPAANLSIHWLDLGGHQLTPYALDVLQQLMAEHEYVGIKNYSRVRPVELGADLAAKALQDNNRESLRSFLLLAAFMAIAMFIMLTATRAHAETRQYTKPITQALVESWLVSYAQPTEIVDARFIAHPAEEHDRHYFPVAPSAMAKNHHTHVQVTGKVTISKREGDGDWHIRITDGKGFAVAECIPELPCAHPKIGQCVRVRGISRIDGEHKYPGTQVGWPEVHPVESLKVVNCHGL